MSNTAIDSEAIPVAVVGCGRMGRLHARVFASMPRVRLAAVVDTREDLARETAAQYGGAPLRDLSDLPPEVKAATIAVPTQAHLAVAEQLLPRGVACLIEKPLAPDEEQAARIVDLAGRHSAVVQVGHIERFNPAVRSMHALGIRPQFLEVTRISPLTFRSIDVGVVLDMMIHDIDIVLRLARSPVSRIDAVGVSVIGDVEDICNARLEFENGCVANMTASRLSLKTERKLRVFSADAYVSLDYQKKYAMVARRTGNLEALRSTVRRIRSGELTDLAQLNFADLVNVEELQIDDGEPLRLELESFIDAATGRCAPAVTAEDGLAAVALARRIVAAMRPQTLVEA